ncbi:MAG: hypothetical protein A3B25_02465 [Candidatus Ryanbacteria bacterium RIFCSPLOWO2_01_FULL_48_26]|uniref:DNA polymerase IV n=1 Tax=Candidatus Ryanbacteria bacterium RIFCSPLOWO2_01_FULL_48_26 TaxID=1802126 RepID=A0A1G2GWI5_9BACT|nr:MAG: hypothetical protein A3B25_02465 [Candidatus Ryanbacteria bacterium RIFCSPLOWO2_01_FULL_48_26]
MKRIIAHLDMDAFFAAIEERDRPRLKGMPIAVGSDPQGGKGRGIVSTANYKAREYGIRSALPISTAWRFSQEAKRVGKPEVVFIEPNFKKYSEVSQNVMFILEEAISAALQHTNILENVGMSAGDLGVEQARPPKFPGGNLERASIDEAYFDLSFADSFDEARKICEKIKKEIAQKEKLTCSIGIGPNKLIAKIASDMKKPDGLTVVREADTEKFLEPLPIRKIPGIGPKTEEVFKKIKVARVADLKKFSEEELNDLFGKPRRQKSGSRPLKASGWGIELYKKIRGIDDSPIVEKYEAKSIGEQETFEKDSRDPGFISGRLKALCEGVFRSFEQSGFDTFRTIVVTVRFADFATKNRSHTLAEPSDSKTVLEFESLKLLMPFFDARENSNKKAVRLIGVRIEKLS